MPLAFLLVGASSGVEDLVCTLLCCAIFLGSPAFSFLSVASSCSFPLMFLHSKKEEGKEEEMLLLKENDGWWRPKADVSKHLVKNRG